MKILHATLMSQGTAAAANRHELGTGEGARAYLEAQQSPGDEAHTQVAAQALDAPCWVYNISQHLDINLSAPLGLKEWLTYLSLYARIHETTCFHAPTCVLAHKTTCFHAPTYVRAHKATVSTLQRTSGPTKPRFARSNVRPGPLGSPNAYGPGFTDLAKI